MTPAAALRRSASSSKDSSAVTRSAVAAVMDRTVVRRAQVRQRTRRPWGQRRRPWRWGQDLARPRAGHPQSPEITPGNLGDHSWKEITPGNGGRPSVGGDDRGPLVRTRGDEPDRPAAGEAAGAVKLLGSEWTTRQVGSRGPWVNQ